MVIFSQDKVRAEELQGVVQDLRLAWSSGARDAEFHETWGNQNREFSMENTNISTNIIQYLPIVGCPRLNKVDHSTSWDDWVLLTHRFMFEMWSLSRVQCKSL